MVPEITPGPEMPAPGTLSAPAGAARFDVNLPNLITLARLLVVPVAIWLIWQGRYTAAFWVFVGAGASDALDGWIAKRFDCRTRTGALLDPAADKALLAGVFVTLGFVHQLPAWLVILVVLRDFLIVLGFALMQTAAAPGAFGPLYVSKVNTLMQLTLIAFVLARLGLGITAGPATWLLIDAAAATTVLSGLAYFVRWARMLARSEPVL